MRLILSLFASIGALLLGLWFWGGQFIAPRNHPIGPPPSDLALDPVRFDGVDGWYFSGQWPQRCVILMHGLNGDRTRMLDRARLLAAAGYSLLLFDFQAHGTTPGNKVSFGYRESWDAIAAVRYMRRERGCQKLGVIAISMGAAASLLGQGPLPVEALVSESLYPDIRSAVRNRMQLRFGDWGRWIEPLLSYQIPLRLKVGLDQLQPIDAIRHLNAPLLLLHGSADRHTTINEAQELFTQAPNPKFFWSVVGAGHEDLYRYAPDAYRIKVLDFFKTYLH